MPVCSFRESLAIGCSFVTIVSGVVVGGVVGDCVVSLFLLVKTSHVMSDGD